ncbi:MAG: YcaO-like family protein [Acidimicrobiaceae bacterium]|nr:YcaO-like family protein [Acidimicrobiaceae bacterium]
MSWQSEVLSRLEPKLQAVQAIDGFHWSILVQSADTGSCGTATTKFEAATKALAELVERISINDSSRFRLEYATAEELDEPDWFQWPSPNGRLDSSLGNARMYWIEGCELETGRQRFLPAHLVFIRWNRSEPWEFRPPISVGAAVHSDKQLALENARDELLEHHTKMLYFFAGRLGEEFKVSGDHHLHDSYEALQRLNVVPYFYRMSIPRGIDVYVSYLESSDIPRLTVGSGTTPEKALAEALQLRLGLESYAKHHEGDDKSVSHDQITDGTTRGLYWGCSEQRTPRERMQPGILSEVELGPSGPYFMVDLTEGLASEVGLHAVKVVAPSSLMVFFAEQEYPGWLTLARTYLRECAYTFPHPFH